MTPETLRARIKGGEPLVELDLRALRLPPGDYAGGIFMRCNLSGMDLSGLDLRDSRYIQCALPGTRWDGAQLSLSLFEGCDLSRASVRVGAAEAMSWSECDATGATLAGTVLENCHFLRCILERTSFAECALSQGGFSECRLAGVDWRGTRQKGTLVFRADLRSARLDGIDWEGVVCVETDLSGQVLSDLRLERCQFNDCKLDGVDLAGARLGQSSFKGALLRGATLTGAQAPRGMFVEADLAESACLGLKAPQSLWAGANLDGADLSGADLTQAILQRSRCAQAAFAQAELTYADFSYADLTRADLRDARFSRTQFHRALLDDARWTSRAGVLDSDAPLMDAERWSAARPTAGRASP